MGDAHKRTVDSITRVVAIAVLDETEPVHELHVRDLAACEVTLDVCLGG